MKNIFLFLILSCMVFGQALTVQNISFEIQKNIPLRVKGKNQKIVEYLYNTMDKQPLWIGRMNKEKSSSLIQALHNPMFNYKQKSFDQRSIRRLFYLIDNDEVEPERLVKLYARLDLILTNSFVRLVRFMVQGDVDWNLVQKKFKMLKKDHDISCTWEMKFKKMPTRYSMLSAIKHNTIHTYLTSLIPMTQRYISLIEILKNYQLMDTFPKLKYYTKVLKKGDVSSRIRGIKKRLQISGDYPQYASLSKKFDETLQNAIKSYQIRYLLKVTGEVDKKMTYYLNEPASKKIEQIIVNLDKTKLYSKSFENEYIEVNLPDFNLRYYIDGYMVKKMGLVVGRLDRPTPIFSNSIKYMVLNPTWTIPDNLIKRDLIPVLEEHPNYLSTHNIHAYRGNKEMNVTYEMLEHFQESKRRVPYRFVQLSGDSNALGKVKFMFPNRYAVYLHDTDNKSLLKLRYRLYSSGCMRVEKPFELLDTLLLHSKKPYPHEKIVEVLETNKPHTISLKKSIPVHIVYFTVYKENELAYFKKDVYLYDKIIKESTGSNKKERFELPLKRIELLPKKKTDSPFASF